MPLNNDYLRQIANSVGQGDTSGTRVLNNEYLRRIAEGIGGIVDPSSGKIDASKIEGVIPAANLPSYVDDVIEGYLYEGAFYTDTNHEYEIEPESGKIYVDVSDDTSYRWTGTAYVSMGAPYELPTMTATTKGGAKLGDGLTITDGALGIDPEPQESTGAVRGAIASLTAKGWATQDGTPTPSTPVTIQVARGRNLYRNGIEATSGTYTSGGITYTIDGSELIADGTASGNSWPYLGGSGTDSRNPVHFKMLQPGTYVASSGANHIQGRRLINDGAAVETLFAKSTPPVTFTLEEASLVAVVPIVNSGKTVNNLREWVQVELGSTPTPYVPYGYVGVNVELPSKLYKAGHAIAADGTEGANTDYDIYSIGGVSAGTYEITYVSSNTTRRTRIHGYDSSGNWVLQLLDVQSTDNKPAGPKARTVTVPEGVVEIRVNHGDDFSDLAATTTIPVPMPSKGYAAALPNDIADVLTIDGAGRVEWVSATGMVTFDGSSDEAWAYASGTPSRVYTQLSDCKDAIEGGYAGYCDYYEVDATVINVANIRDSTILLSNKKASSSNGRLFVFDNARAASLNDWTAWLAQNHITVLYPLATPVTEQCGYIDWPTIPDGATITCPELDALGVRYLVGNGVAEMAQDWYERGHAEAQSNATALGELAQSVLDVDGKADAVAAQLVAEDVSSAFTFVQGSSFAITSGTGRKKVCKALGFVWFNLEFSVAAGTTLSSMVVVAEVDTAMLPAADSNTKKVALQTNVPKMRAEISFGYYATYVYLVPQESSVTMSGGDTVYSITGSYYVG